MHLIAETQARHIVVKAEEVSASPCLLCLISSYPYMPCFMEHIEHPAENHSRVQSPRNLHLQYIAQEVDSFLIASSEVFIIPEYNRFIYRVLFREKIPVVNE